jgi:hypothetical protein
LVTVLGQFGKYFRMDRAVPNAVEQVAKLWAASGKPLDLLDNNIPVLNQEILKGACCQHCEKVGRRVFNTA